MDAVDFGMGGFQGRREFSSVGIGQHGVGDDEDSLAWQRADGRRGLEDFGRLPE